uniref:Tim44-like domain-containing protein n=1 Tax=Kalanchoe fedtschenkoi TaxID=63787 RepID=A0A7N0VHG8_KALFE
MATRKLLRDSLLYRRPLYSQLKGSHSISRTNTRWLGLNPSSELRSFSVFNDFSNKVKGEATSNSEFQQSVKELKQKAEELRGVKEDLKVRTKQTTEHLYKKVDGVWTEGEAVAKKVSATVKEKLSAATEEVKESFKNRKPEHSESTSGSSNCDAEGKSNSTSEDFKNYQAGFNDNAETVFGKLRSAASVASSKLSSGYQSLREAKVVDIAKKGYGIVKDELTGNPSKRKHIQHDMPSPSTVERSTRTDVVLVPSKQSRLSKKWEAIKEKMRSHPLFKRVSEPVVTKSQEIVEDLRDTWETSDHPVVHKIQDLNETIFGETHAAISFKEIRRRDPNFSLPDFVAEVQDVIKPVLIAYMKGDAETLKKYCSSEVIERCKAEHKAYQSQGIFFDNKILHISEVEVRETKMMGSSPIIIVVFQTQQVYCIRDRDGAIKEGGKDTIHTVFYAWAMQQVDPEELGEGAYFPIWRLREMQQLGIQALI